LLLTAIIGNKQDLLNALSIKEIETLTTLKAYPMVANRKENRNKIIRIIADVLDISTETSPLLKDLFTTLIHSMDIYNPKEINTIRKYYSQILKKSIG